MVHEKDLPSRQLEGCWNVPVGAADPENLKVEVRVFMNRDGTLREAQIIDSERTAKDKYFRAMVESVLRAIKHPNCNPMKLPADKYEVWKEMTLIFDPNKLVGR